MEFLEKHKESLIVQRALALFFYNYSTYPEIIEEMKAENENFKNEWELLEQGAHEQSKKSGLMVPIEYRNLFAIFAENLTYKGQALLLEKVMKRYETLARKDIEFSIEMNAKAQSIKKERVIEQPKNVAIENPKAIKRDHSPDIER